MHDPEVSDERGQAKRLDHIETVLVGGTEKRPIEIVDWTPAWPARFESERLRILGALKGTARRIEHMGSTAVPGLAAKPVVDILVSVADPDDEERFGPALHRAGYEIRVREPGHRMFRTPERDVHVHVWRSGSQDEWRHLLFRDWLRRSPTDRRLYEEVKRQLARRDWADMNLYADAKTDVIAEIMGRADTWAAASDWTLDAR